MTRRRDQKGVAMRRRFILGVVLSIVVGAMVAVGTSLGGGGQRAA